jgi:catechol 2,3-dioxygenase-like lactoylglutathione lyase family enzyme
MKMSILAVASAAALVSMTTLAVAQPPAAAPSTPPAPRPAPAPTPMKGVAPPANLTPNRISGVGINVENLEGMKDWYVTTLGMKVIRTYDRAGAVYEYILNIGGEGGNLALIKGARQPGSTTYGRLILIAPDSDKLAAHLTASGIATRKVAEGAYFFRDPEGNNVEIFTQPATPPAAAAPARK